MSDLVKIIGEAEQASTRTVSGQSVFAALAPTSQSHFVLHIYAAVFWLINHLRHLYEAEARDLDDVFADHPFLLGYFVEMLDYLPDGISWEEAARWWSDEITGWEANVPVHLPLCKAGAIADPDLATRIALMLVGLVEEDAHFGTLYAALQAPLPQRRPSLDLIAQILRTNRSAAATGMGSACQPLIDAGYLHVANPDAPRAEWILSAPALIWALLQADSSEPSIRLDLPHGLHYRPIEALKSMAAPVLPATIDESLQRLPALVVDKQVQIIVMRGAPGSDWLHVVGKLARRLGRGLVLAPGERLAAGDESMLASLGPFCQLSNALPVIRMDLAPGETVSLPRLKGHQGITIVILGTEGGLESSQMRHAVTLNLPAPTLVERRQIWADALNSEPIEDADLIAERFHLGGGHIRQAAEGALLARSLRGGAVVQLEDVRSACRSLNRQMLDTLAAPISNGATWERLIASQAVDQKLREVATRCRHRERLLAHLGVAFADNANRGVRALFNGPSGTGKTLAASVIANELGQDLYRVDLSAIINKYIGETEKNLHKILTYAEALDVILLLDEGDSLLGSRTDVKSANDRYANLETNFLLQRLETYQGIVLVTTNMGEHIDSAFQRRMDVVVDFTQPQEQERWQIWLLHLPADHAIPYDYLEEVAVRCTLTGGQIRNAALHAALLAVDEDQTDAQVRQPHLEAALVSEYRKAGASYPLRATRRGGQSSGQRNGRRRNVETFIGG